jgi:hypothetical protein
MCISVTDGVRSLFVIFLHNADYNHTCELFSMIKWEIFIQKDGDLEFAINKEGRFDIKKREISLICENTPYFKKNL